jgi:ornithine cyclodeaminase
MVVVLSDTDIRSSLRASDAVEWMRDAVLAHHSGLLVAPPRVAADLDDGRLVFTAGRLRGDWFGYRSYDSLGADPGEQVVVVQDESTGMVRAISTGNELGPRRVGGIGGAAADALSHVDSHIVAIIGSGTQARTQLWAIASVRDVDEVRVYSPKAARREAFAEWAATATAARCVATASAQEAVSGAEIVVVATSSAAPVIDPKWLARGVYVTTLGPKQRGRAEFGPELAAAASLITTDSLDQIDAYDPPNILVGTPQHDRLVSLGAVLAGEVSAAPQGEITLFCSVGLAGTEAYLLDRLTSQ